MNTRVISEMTLLLQLLLLTNVFILLTSAKDSIQVVSFRKSKTTQDGPIKCALDTANDTISSSSLQHCSLACVRDSTCASFNIKEPTTCDLYNYNAKVFVPVASCTNYKVALKLSFSFRTMLWRAGHRGKTDWVA